MGGFGSIIQTAAGAFDKKRQRQLEDEKRAQAQEMSILQRALLEAQVGKLQSETGSLRAAADAYIQQYPELASLQSNPTEVVQRGRARDQEALIRGRPFPPQIVVSGTGEFVEVPRTKEQTPLSPLRPSPTAPGDQGIGSQTATPRPGTRPDTARPTPQQPAPTQTPSGAPRPQPAQGARGTGVKALRPGLITPSSTEIDAANWAPGVMQGFTGFRDAWRSDPRAVQEAVPFLQALDIAASVPGIGSAISGATRAAAQQGLSPAAQKVVQSFLRWTASRVFATGGKQLTQNEIRAAIGQYMPAIGEDPATSEQRLESMAQDATNVLFATGRAYPRIKRNLAAAGAPDLGDFDPYTQQFTGTVTFRDLLGPVPTAPRPGRYGYQRPR